MCWKLAAATKPVVTRSWAVRVAVRGRGGFPESVHENSQQCHRVSGDRGDRVGGSGYCFSLAAGGTENCKEGTVAGGREEKLLVRVQTVFIV